MKKKANANKLKLKPIFMAFALMATSSALSFAACTTTEDTTDDGTNTETSVAKTDTQFIKNGNFEFYNENKDEDDEGVYYISSVNNWTNSSLGTPASDVKSGIIGTGDSVWKGFTATDLAGKLDANNELESDADDYEESYLDFNGLESSDLPFKDTEGSLKEDATISADSYIANPGAVIYTKNGKEGYYDNDGDFVELYKDGNVYYTDSAKTEEYNNHVLMVHNYTYSHKDSSENVIHNGTAQKYKSSTTVTLEANTVAEFSVWVKTANLKFNGNNDVHQNRGAFIEVEHTVGGTTLDSMIIKNINTEKFAKDNVGESNNGWYNYTVYIEACDCASTTVTISLGLGESGAENYVEGYAFFDDIKMIKYTDLDKTSYDANSVKATCSLTDEADEKVFIADKLTHGEGAPDVRNSEDFKYLLDLTASQERVDANNSNVKYEVGLTVDANKYSSSKDMPTPVGNATKKTQTVTPFYPKFNIGTSDDVVAALKVTSIKNDITNVIKGNYANKIADALYTANALPGVDVSTDAVVILSTEGAAYTTSISAKAAN
ncbi:MAG: hypothetical protein J6B04_01725, partial [Clostridia bacterium]|nr:hypothetical protein [Clostridia bacterium]